MPRARIARPFEAGAGAPSPVGDLVDKRHGSHNDTSRNRASEKAVVGKASLRLGKAGGSFHADDQAVRLDVTPSYNVFAVWNSKDWGALHNHIVGDVERGVKLYERGGVEFAEDMNLGYIADILERNDIRRVKVQFTRDGRDVESFYCNKCSMRSNGAVCRHIVAAVLAVQGGIVETKLTLGKTASVTTTVTKAITAKAIGSGSLDVFATPMMIALMEKAACECLEDTLAYGQTSVGMQISVEHSAASLIDSKIRERTDDRRDYLRKTNAANERAG